MRLGYTNVHACGRALNVRYWHKADMPVAPHMSAFGGKADMPSSESAKLKRRKPEATVFS